MLLMPALGSPRAHSCPCSKSCWPVLRWDALDVSPTSATCWQLLAASGLLDILVPPGMTLNVIIHTQVALRRSFRPWTTLSIPFPSPVTSGSPLPAWDFPSLPCQCGHGEPASCIPSVLPQCRTCDSHRMGQQLTCLSLSLPSLSSLRSPGSSRFGSRKPGAIR